MKRYVKAAVSAGCAAAMILGTGVFASAEETKTLRVAMECGYAPYNWTQPTDENGAVPISDSNEYAYGYDVMMAQHICEELGYDLEIVTAGLGFSGSRCSFRHSRLRHRGPVHYF